MIAAPTQSVISQIENSFSLLTPHLSLGSSASHEDETGGGVVAPLVRGASPTNPTLFGLLCNGVVHIGVQWVGAIRVGGNPHELIAKAINGGLEDAQSVDVAVALLVLTTNKRPRASAAGVDFESGEIYLQDQVCAVHGTLINLSEKLISLVEHAHEIRAITTRLESCGYHCAPLPESELAGTRTASPLTTTNDHSAQEPKFWL